MHNWQTSNERRGPNETAVQWLPQITRPRLLTTVMSSSWSRRLHSVIQKICEDANVKNGNIKKEGQEWSYSKFGLKEKIAAKFSISEDQFSLSIPGRKEVITTL